MSARDALHQACYVGMATEVEADFRIDAYRAEILREYANKIRSDAALDIEGLSDDCCREYGLALARWMDAQAASAAGEPQ